MMKTVLKAIQFEMSTFVVFFKRELNTERNYLQGNLLSHMLTQVITYCLHSFYSDTLLQTCGTI